MDPFTIGTSLLSAGSSIAEGISASKAKEAAAFEKRKAAKEIIARANINKEIRSKEGMRERSKTFSDMASKGLSAESSQPFLEMSLADEMTALLNIEREAKWEEAALNREASSLDRAAEFSKLSGYASGIGSILKDGKSIYDSYKLEQSYKKSGR